MPVNPGLTSVLSELTSVLSELTSVHPEQTSVFPEPVEGSKDDKLPSTGSGQTECSRLSWANFRFP